MKRKTELPSFFILVLTLFALIAWNIPLRDTLVKELEFDKYTLADTYMYNKTQRVFQWDKIMSVLDSVDTFTKENSEFGYIINYKNRKGVAPLVKTYHSNNAYRSLQDTFGVFRYQAIPLYEVSDSTVPFRYGRDGSLIAIKKTSPTFYVVEVASIPGQEWLVPKKYIKPITTNKFKRFVVIDRLYQNIATLEHDNDTWYIRSMNPATTGRYHPPFSKVTPKGIFMLQEKVPRMLYYRDGTTDIEGYAPYASRFSCGGYVHGVPVNNPSGAMIEYSPTLGTIPRSHMCVRNATSHAKYIYDNYPANETIVYIFD
ncbi:MAG: L,D-transpeptidase [Marinifilaceae bacterium]